MRIQILKLIVQISRSLILTIHQPNKSEGIAIRAARKEVPADHFSFSAIFFHLQHVDYTINSQDSFFHKKVHKDHNH
jgi:hypothetical protein